MESRTIQAKRPGYAEVCVNSPAGRDQTFSYAIPAGLNTSIGQAVWVPFGNKTLQGIVIELTAKPAVAEVKEITGVIESKPLLSPEKVALARWLSEYYLSPLFDAISLMLPPGFERRVMTFLNRTGKSVKTEASRADTAGNAPAAESLSPEQVRVLEIVGDSRVNLKEIEKALGKRKVQAAVSRLVNRGLLERSYELEKPKVKPKTATFLRLLVSEQSALELASALSRKRAKKQAGLLELLVKAGQPVSLADARKEGNYSSLVIKQLAAKGLVRLESVAVKREPIASLQMALSLPLALTSAQLQAFQAIKKALNNLNSIVSPSPYPSPLKGEEILNQPFASDSVTEPVEVTEPKGNKQSSATAETSISHLDRLDDRESPKNVFLLHGVTGSGKTEIYLQALAETVRLGKRGIVLVPEISLTPQTIERFAARFPNRVAVLHSRLSLGEQFDEWQRIRDGEFDVVIGPRSALFAPQPELGLIVIDEEHEWNYKQTDKSPRYHARNAALKLAELTGAVVVLGSATPDVGTYYRAKQGAYRLLALPERVTPNEGSPLPEVAVVDLKQELMTGNRSIFSRSLSHAINEALANEEQVILFLNRRGGATFVQCRHCGFVMRCKRCDVSLTYHPDENVLICHQCNYRVPVPLSCPRCASRRIKFVGIGTQKVEQEAAKDFPSARLLRWDSDVTSRRNSPETFLNRFRDRKADILIGTQMITKGLDIPNVTLVGVINADTALNLPDFRAGERTYQLLCQVAGRAGRGPRGGKVIIQSYEPTHYAIQAAAKHDYAQFYEKEMAYRRELNDPPFTRLLQLLYSHSSELRCREAAAKMRDTIINERDANGIAGLSIIGPAPAFVPRLRGRYRWSLVLRGANPTNVIKNISFPRGWTIDVDPVGVI